MRKIFESVSHCFILICTTLLFISKSLLAESLAWENSRNVALSRAIAENKMVVLLVGRPGCGDCHVVKTIHFESTAVTCPANSKYCSGTVNIKELIENRYIPWYCDSDKSSDWKAYFKDFPGTGLPFIALINPKETHSYMTRWNGPQNSLFAYKKLLDFQSGIQ